MIPYQNISFDGSLNLISTIILTRYFTNYGPCSLEIYDDAGIKKFGPSVHDFPRIMLNETGLKFRSKERCQNILISTANPFRTFILMEDFIKKRSEIRYNNRRYFFILHEQLPECDEFYNATLNNSSAVTCEQLKKLKFVLDVLIMRCDNYTDEESIKNGKCTFYTYIIKEKASVSWLYLDDWFWHNQSFLFDRDLFPSRIADVDALFGREFRKLKAGATDYLPYSYIEPMMGMELRAVVEYSKKYNFSLTITNDEQYWGEIYPNWTGTGVLGGVAMDKYDIGFSALFALPERILYSDFSRPTAYSCVSCIVPAPRKVQSWLTPIKGFTLEIWMAVIGSFFAVALTFRIIKHFLLGFDKSLTYIQTLSTFGMFIMQPLINSQVPAKFPLRLIYTVLLIFSLLITTVYNSRLSSLLVIPSYEGEIRTVDDLALSGVLWGELAIDWVLPLEVDERPIYETIYTNFRVASEDTLREYSLKNNFAFGMERLITGYYAVGAYLQEDVINKYRAMKSDLYRQYTCLQLRKSSVLLPSIDLFLTQARDYGLLYFWEDQINIYYNNYKVQQSLRNPPKDDTVVILQVHHIIGLFVIWGIGLTLSIITFVLEIYLFRTRRTHLKDKLKLYKAKFVEKQSLNLTKHPT